MRRLAIPLAIFALSACSDRPPEITPAELTEVWTLANLGVAHIERFEFLDAVDTWERVLEIAPEWGTARINLAIATLNQGKPEAELEAIGILEEVRREDPANPWANYCLCILLKRQQRYEEAERCIRAVLEVDPGDPDSWYELGDLLQETDRFQEAREALERVVELEPMHKSAWFRLSSALAELEEDEARAEALRRFQTLDTNKNGIERKIVYGKMGFYANAVRDFELPRPPRTVPPVAPSFGDGSEAAGLAAVPHAPARALELGAWLRGQPADPGGFAGGVACADLDQDGDLDLAFAGFGPGPDAVVCLRDGQRFADASESLGLPSGDARTIAIAAADFDGDTLPELFLGRAGPDRMLAREIEDFGGPFARSIGGLSDSSEVTISVAVGDIDQDGDLDLCLGRERGLALLRWDGEAFEDVTEGSGVERGKPSLGVVLADVDGDGDLDIAAGSPAPHAWINDRRWGFTRAGLPGGGDKPFTSVTLGDVNGDELSDWVLASPLGGTRILLADRERGFVQDTGFSAVAERTRALGTLLIDADRDGDLDCLCLGEELALYANEGERGWRDVTQEAGLAGLAVPGVRGHVMVDQGGDGDADVVIARNGRPPFLLENRAAAGPSWIGVLPRGFKDHTASKGRSLGIGTRVEVETLGVRRVAYSGLGGGFASVASPLALFDLGGGERCGVRLLWADRVVQNESDVPGGRVHEILQNNREPSSCPLVFFWNGTSHEYLTDCLGTGGVGFMVEPGSYGPPDPEEVVRIGERLAQRDGRYEVLLAEPMEEVTYLDQATLLRVDHPDGTLVFPDERFATGGERETGRPLLVREDELVLPVRARSVELGTPDPRQYARRSSGPRDDLELVTEVDRRAAEPLAEHRRLQGYAAPWATELAFPAAPLAGAGEPVYLFVDGWIEYPFSRLNYAAWQGELRMESWTLEVPDGRGGWRAVVPELGYPAGKPRTMAFEVTPWVADMVAGDELRLRLSSNLVVSIDRVFLARDLSAAALASGAMRTSEVAPREALLRFAGFPREYSPDGRRPLLFDRTNVDRTSDFKALAGLHTSYGDALDLVLERDDRFAIYSRGDELALRFDPSDLPEAAGPRSTWLLRVRGYCKDMCPHTAEPDTVEPLPFAAMEGYPPERPLGDAHPSALAPQNARREPPRAVVR